MWPAARIAYACTRRTSAGGWAAAPAALAYAPRPCPRFHPLLQLREARARIELLVDSVVEGYHSGFNTSLHNYSQILRLFTESRLQVRVCPEARTSPCRGDQLAPEQFSARLADAATAPRMHGP